MVDWKENMPLGDFPSIEIDFDEGLEVPTMVMNCEDLAFD
jgi:hypothetical protein